MRMGVHTESSARDRRPLTHSQDENGTAKRFKSSSSPMLVSKDETSLKIRISRYGTAPSRTNHTTEDDTGNASGSQSKEIVSSSGEPETVRPTRSSSTGTPGQESSDVAVKQEQLKMCEVKLSNLTNSMKVEDGDETEVGAEEATTKSKLEHPTVPHPVPKINTHMTASEIVDECYRVGPGPGPISTSLLDEGEPCPQPKRRSSLPQLSPSQLLPPTPCVQVKNKQEAFSPQLLEWCLQRPITVIRGLAQSCDLDLSLYTTKTLVASHPNHPLEIRSQLEQTSDENWDPALKNQVWYCTSSRSHTTISKYAEYLNTSLKETKYKLGPQFTFNPKMDMKNDPDTGLPVRKTIKFGTNCDLSDEKKWKPQIQELMKLPCWLRVVSAGNMLSHIGHQILGMNTIQLYMKVPCSRTPGHQENNNFAAVNINIGPGDSEWFGVPDEYWGPLQELCVKNKVDYLHGSWWPKMEDLKEAGIPCYRFMQRPGEVVWVNTGCVHWVQAAGWCNNVAWNTGPLTFRQYKCAIERYEWNKSQRYQSIVAMDFLTWNMARNIQVNDVDLYQIIRRTMMRSLRKIVFMRCFAMKHDLPIRFHGHRSNEPVNYCMVCEEEVFNIFFVKGNEKKHVVHCLRCARQVSKNLAGWICLEEYDLDELKAVYDGFTLGHPMLPTGDNPLKLSLVNNNQSC